MHRIKCFAICMLSFNPQSHVLSKAGSEQFNSLSKVTQLSRKQSLDSMSEHQRFTLLQHQLSLQGQYCLLGLLLEIYGDDFGSYTDGEL